LFFWARSYILLVSSKSKHILKRLTGKLYDNAEEALLNFPNSGAQVILADYYLPGMTGLEFLRRIAAPPAGDGGPWRVIVSAEAFSDEMHTELGHAIDATILKPFTLKQLTATLISLGKQFGRPAQR
jgi:CheY-like chemotaxis protein